MKADANMEENFHFGSCTTMCSAREMKRREAQGLLHKFEYLKGTESNKRPKADVEKLVAEYSRPAAGKKEIDRDDLRPPSVLLRTVNYLIKTILPRTDVSRVVIYDFVSDRIRAVCQELTIQRADGTQSREILTLCVKFYLFSSCKLFDVVNATLYDPHINSTLLLDCLKRLIVLYENTTDDRRGFVEIESVYTTYNFGSTEALIHAMSLPKELRSERLLKTALDLNFAYLQGNATRALRGFAGLPPLLRCSLYRNLQRLRRGLLLSVSVSHSSRSSTLPLEVLCLWLGMPGQIEAAGILCCHYGLSLTSDRKSVVLLKRAFDLSQKVAPLQEEESLRLLSFSDLFS